MKRLAVKISAILVVAVMFAASASALENTGDGAKQQVSVTVVDDGKTAVYVTGAETLAEFFAEEGIIINRFDVVEPIPATVLTGSTTVAITRYVQFTVKIYNRELYTQLNPIVRAGSVEYAMRQFSEQTGKEYEYSYPLPGYNKVDSDTFIELYPINIFENVSETVIPFISETVYSEEYPEGTEFLQTQGTDGIRRTVETITYTGGYETSREITFDGVILQPVNAVTVIGVAKPAPLTADLSEQQTEIPAGPLMPDVPKPVGEVMGASFEQELIPVIDGMCFEYTMELSMTATAYTADYASTGKKQSDKWFGITASGLKAQVGVVAVDPSVIPLFTKLYIEGYGYAIAGDTGKSIKGNKIDLFFDTSGEVKKFGVQSLKVYVLSDQDFEIALKK